MKTISLIAATLLILLSEFAAAQILDQSPVGSMACGPCAFVNSLYASKATQSISALRGDSILDKAYSFIESYGSAKSIPFGEDRTAYSTDHGVCDVDLHAMIKAFAEDNQLPVPDGDFIVRLENESSDMFLGRIQELLTNSIDNGFHPLICVFDIVAEYNESREKHVWNTKGGHWIAIHSVGEPGKDSLGFTIEFSDSGTGELKTGVAFLDPRKAVAPLTYSVNKNRRVEYDWISNTKTLSLLAPGMPMRTKSAKFHQRTFIAIRYLIHQQ